MNKIFPHAKFFQLVKIHADTVWLAGGAFQFPGNPLIVFWRMLMMQALIEGDDGGGAWLDQVGGSHCPWGGDPGGPLDHPPWDFLPLPNFVSVPKLFSFPKKKILHPTFFHLWGWDFWHLEGG